MLATSQTKLCCIIGNPIEHSLSPIMHNAGYNALKADFVFLAFKTAGLKETVKSLCLLNVKGIVVTIPFKKEVLNYVDEQSLDVQAIGAANTIVNENGKLIAFNTDWTGAMQTLKAKTKISGKKVAVLGAGGAARAIVYGLKKENAIVTVCNRTVENGKKLAEEFALEGFVSLSDQKAIKNADIIINTTSVGMFPKKDYSPIPKSFLQPRHLVFDIVYTPKKTKLLKEAQAVGAKVVFGDAMVLATALPQFELFTGQKPPVKIMQEALERALKK